VISEADFKAYVFANPYKFYTEANPNLFEGPAIAAQVGKDAAQLADKLPVAV